MKKIFDWIWYSSANPSKVSLSVRAAGLLLIPQVLSVITTACGFGLVCLPIDDASLRELVQVGENIVFWVLSSIGGLMFIYGFIRKIGNSVK